MGPELMNDLKAIADIVPPLPSRVPAPFAGYAGESTQSAGVRLVDAPAEPRQDFARPALDDPSVPASTNARVVLTH